MSERTWRSTRSLYQLLLPRRFDQCQTCHLGLRHPSTRASTVFRWKTGCSTGSTGGSRDFPKLQKHR